MKVHKINNRPYTSMFSNSDRGVVRKVAKRDTGAADELPVDQFSGKRFFRNDCGWPMNDIMAYEESQNDTIAQAVLRRINVMPSNLGDKCESLQERFDTIVPSNWSSPAEYVGISKRLASYQLQKIRAKAEAAQAKAEAAAKKAPKKVDVKPE